MKKITDLDLKDSKYIFFFFKKKVPGDAKNIKVSKSRIIRKSLVLETYKQHTGYLLTVDFKKKMKRKHKWKSQNCLYANKKKNFFLCKGTLQ